MSFGGRLLAHVCVWTYGYSAQIVSASDDLDPARFLSELSRRCRSAIGVINDFTELALNL